MEYLQQIQLMNPTFSAYFALGVSVLLLFCSAFVSASEIAFFSLSPSELSEIEEETHNSDRKILKLKENNEHLLATILISNNFVNVAIIMLLNFFFSKWVYFGPGTELLQFVLMTVLLTFLLLLFGEIMPKIYSKSHTLLFCRMAAPTLYLLDKIFHPLSLLLMGSKKITSHIVNHEAQSLTVDELEQALELTDKNEIAEESSMLEGIIRFGGESVKEIMTPRVDMVGLEIHTSFDDVLKCIVENNYSRIPVYLDNEDNIRGILYIKDLLPHLDKTTKRFRWQSLIRPAMVVPETKMIDDLLRDFQTQKVHIAIVVDEFGGTSGIVTMEDIIEEIVGEINDEYDEEETPYVKLNQNTFLFEAKTQLSDFSKIMNLDDEFFDPVVGEADTLAGLLLEIKGEFPKLHECIDYENIHFEVMKMDERRIVEIKVVIRDIKQGN